MKADEKIPAEFVKAMQSDRLLWLQQQFKSTMRMLWTRIDAGMSSACAVQDAVREIDVAYKAACSLEGIPPKNSSLDPCSIDLQARFALDAAILALKGGGDEHTARKAFWAIMRKATTPSLTA